MAQIRLLIDPIANSLVVWWGDKNKSDHAIEAEHSWDIIMVDTDENPLGMEKLNFLPKELEPAKYLPKAAKYLMEATTQLAE